MASGLKCRLSLLAVGISLTGSLAGCQQMAGRAGMEWKRDEGGMLVLRAAQPGKKASQGVVSKNPDERREAVLYLSDPGRCSQDAVVRLLGDMVRHDEDPTVRSAAARALGGSIHPGAIDPLLAALEDRTDFVRLDATVALSYKIDENVKRALLMRLNKDKETDARIRAEAAHGLSNYHERRVVEALISALRSDPDFAVNYHAEQSLIRMTGHTHEYDAEAWTRWLAGLGPDGDPFAQAGQIPPSLYPSRPPLTQRMRESLHNAWFWWQADEKPPE